MKFTYRHVAIGSVAVFSFVLLIVFASYDTFVGIEPTVAATLPAVIGTQPTVQAQAVRAGERLKIPRIGVDAAIEHVALTPDGAMDTPDGPLNVGWYSLGSYPGEEGSAVIAGHRGWRNGQPAVFDNLDKLQVGDTIAVVTAKGEEHTFKVRETRRYDRDSVVPEVFVSDEGTHLQLITCVGPWDRELKSSAERLVVFADAVL